MYGTETNTTNGETEAEQNTTNVDTDAANGPDDEGDNGGETNSADGE